MEFSSFSTDMCEPAADGGVTPGLVPIPTVDPDELDEAVGRLRAIGEAIEESGEGITSAWASLTGIYVAPEADTLLSVLDPVSSDGSTVATGVRDAADALTTFAETARELKARLSGLKAEAEAFRADVGSDEEWLEDEDQRERNNDLNNRIATAVHEYQEAERDCANKIGEHYGGTWFTGYSDKASHDQTSTDSDRTYQLYGTTGPRTDQANPWGSPVDAPTSAWEDAFWGLGDLAIGAVVGLGLSTGLYRNGELAYPFGTEHGQNVLANWEDTKDSFWAVMGSDAQGEWADPGGLDAQWHNSREALIEVGDSIVPVSEWDDRPMYTVVNGVGNVALMFTPTGWARTFFDSPAGGSAPDAHLDGSLSADRGPNGVSSGGSGLHGTDTVSMSSADHSVGQSVPSSPIGGMNEALGALQEQLNGAAAPDTGTPTGSSSPEAVSAAESPTSSSTPAPESSSSSTSTSDSAPPIQESAPRSGEGAPSREAVDDSGAANDPTAQDIQEGTTAAGAEGSPWAASPVDDGSAREASPTAPINAAADGGGPGRDGTAATDTTDGGSGSDGDHSRPQEDGTATPAESGGGQGGGGRDDGSGPPPGSPDDGQGPNSDDGSSDSTGHGGTDGRREDDEGDLLLPESEPDTDVPLQDRLLDRASDDPRVQELIPTDGRRFGEGVTLDPNTRYTLPEADGERFTEYITDGEGRIREIRADSEGWNGKHPEFLDPRPDMTYVVDGRYTFRTDEYSRTVSAEGFLTREVNDRNDYRQTGVGDAGEQYFELLNEQIRNDFHAVEGRWPEPGEVPQYQDIEYQGGHLIASQFFGIGENLNMVPMRYDVNQNRTLTAFHDRNPNELGTIEGAFANVERAWRGILRDKGKWHGFEEDKFNDGTWDAALALNPENPQIDVKVTNVYDPNLPEIEDPDNPGRMIQPPPSMIEVEWYLNGVKMTTLEYENLPPLEEG
jgi:hypothetical protein